MSPDTVKQLAAHQALVDSGAGYEDQVIRAKHHFAASNHKMNPAFREVRAQLSAMCSGARRCMYCEDSVADEVEHHKPKDLFPSLAFNWDNFLYACGPCNGPKGNRFAIVVGTTIINISRSRSDPIRPPQDGPSALVHPRFEDPLSILFLDIKGETFRFTPHPAATDLDQLRAAYTIDVLSLNKNDFLLAARSEAYHSYLSRLRQYNQTKLVQGSLPPLVKQRDAIIRMQHPTVFREMVRQAGWLPEVLELIDTSPEIRTW